MHDLNLRRGLAAGAGIFSAVALGIALQSGDPASAVAPPPDGNYSFNQAGVSGVTWTITALCDQVNGSRYYKDYSNPDIQADFCALNIVSATDEQVSREDKLHNYGGRARLTSGRSPAAAGLMVRPRPAPATCAVRSPSIRSKWRRAASPSARRCARSWS